MPSLLALGWKIHDHLKAHRPKMFQEMQENGTLFPFLKDLENKASDQLISLENHGLSHFEAWEIVKDQVLLPAETDVPRLGETMQPYQDRPSKKKKSPLPPGPISA